MKSNSKNKWMALAMVAMLSLGFASCGETKTEDTAAPAAAVETPAPAPAAVATPAPTTGDSTKMDDANVQPSPAGTGNAPKTP